MKTRNLLALFFFCMSLASVHAKPDPHKLKCPHEKEELVRLATLSVQKGFDYLLKTQNEDGTWGSRKPELTKLSDFGFAHLNEGGHRGVKIACTSICASALLASPTLTDEQEAALQRAIKVLLTVETIAFKKGQTFNIWGYTYKLQFLANLATSSRKEKYLKEIQAAATHSITKLEKFQQHEGGWMYYSSEARNSDSTSFTTAVIIDAMARLKNNNIKVSAKVLSDAVRVLKRLRAPDHSFHYSTGHIKSKFSATRVLGTGSRSVVSYLSLLEAKTYSLKEAKIGLDLFNRYQLYLEESRKHTTPHSGAENIASYYYFFGYNYASILAEQVKMPQKEWDAYAWHMLRTQEDDGRWWDTPCGQYGSKWGTGFAIQTLLRYIKQSS